MNSPESTPNGNSQLPVKQERTTQIINLNEERVKRNHKGHGKTADPEVLRPAIENALQEEKVVAVNELNEEQRGEALARKKEVEARLNEIRPNGIILNANDSEEYAELQKELHSLDERLNENKKPGVKKEAVLEDPIATLLEIEDTLYIDLKIFEKGPPDESGVSRTWTKNETKNALQTMIGRLDQKLESLTQLDNKEAATETQGKINALNEILSKIDTEEVTNSVFVQIKEIVEKNITPSERVIDLVNQNAYVRKWDKETPESTDSISETDKELPSQYEAALARHGKEEESKVAKEQTPEERIAALEVENKELKEKIDALLAKTNENLEANGGTPETRAKKLGIDSFEQIVSGIGEKWSKFPSKYKFAISAALIIGGTATTMAGAPLLASAFAGTAVGLRALGGISMYFGIKRFLNTYQERNLKGDEKLDPHREDLNKMTAAGIALTLAIALPGFLQQEFQNAEAYVNEFLNPEEALATVTPETSIDASAIVTPEVQTTLVPAEKIAELATVKPGQGFWQPIYNQLAEANPEWSKAELNAETHKLLLQNNIINPDGTELRVQPGEQIVLNKDNTIAFNKEGTYSFKEPVVEAPVTEPPIEQPTEVIEQAAPQIVIDEAALSRNTDMYVRNYVNEMFGGKGFFGFGATSPDAIDKIKDWGGHFGFSNHTISEIMNHEEGPMMVESSNRYGINNPASLEKMQQAISQVAQETGVEPLPSEKSEEYFRRAVFTSLKNSALKGQ